MCIRDREQEADALVKTLLEGFDQYVNSSKKVPSEVLTSLGGIDEPGRLADTVAAHMSLELRQKQDILEVPDVLDRIEHLIALMEVEADLVQVEKRIRGRVKKQMEKSQREYYLNEQMKAIQRLSLIHISEPTRPLYISYAVFCLKKKR